MLFRSIHGEASFADLVRQHDWQAHPPADLRTLADAACFEGMGALREVVVSPGPTLRLEGLLFAPPAPARPIVVEVGPTGAETVHRPAG